jgi:hypothetical protein
MVQVYRHLGHDSLVPCDDYRGIVEQGALLPDAFCAMTPLQIEEFCFATRNKNKTVVQGAWAHIAPQTFQHKSIPAQAQVIIPLASNCYDKKFPACGHAIQVQSRSMGRSHLVKRIKYPFLMPPECD